MGKNRLEAFSDGVFAIIVTIMVLELKAPHGDSWRDLIPFAPTFLSYVLSFIYVGIYWTNHHHLFQLVGKVNGGILWANLHLLFWLSLIPWVTAWLGESHPTEAPLAAYGLVLLMSAIAFSILVRTLLHREPPNSALRIAIGSDVKGNISGLLYVLGIALSFVYPPAALAFYVVVAAIWIIPDRRVEKIVS